MNQLSVTGVQEFLFRVKLNELSRTAVDGTAKTDNWGGRHGAIVDEPNARSLLGSCAGRNGLSRSKLLSDMAREKRRVPWTAGVKHGAVLLCMLSIIFSSLGVIPEVLQLIAGTGMTCLLLQSIICNSDTWDVKTVEKLLQGYPRDRSPTSVYLSSVHQDLLLMSRRLGIYPPCLTSQTNGVLVYMRARPLGWLCGRGMHKILRRKSSMSR